MNAEQRAYVQGLPERLQEWAAYTAERFAGPLPPGLMPTEAEAIKGALAELRQFDPPKKRGKK
jgi:hypothetical protein